MIRGETITEGLPEGWVLQMEWAGDQPTYRAYRRFHVQKTLGPLQFYAKGWKRTTIRARHLSDALVLVRTADRQRKEASK